MTLASRVVAAALAAIALSAAGPGLAAPPSARDFAANAQIANVSIAPDGQHIVALLSAAGQERTIAVWETAHPDRPPALLGSQRMQLIAVSFIKNDRLAVTAQQTFTYGTTRTHLQKIYITDLKGETWAPALPESRGQTEDDAFLQRVGNPSILSRLPGDPRHILVVNRDLDGVGDIYKVDLYGGGAERVARGSDKFGGYQADAKGEIRARQSIDFDNGKVYVAQQIKSAAGVWEEQFRSYAKDRNLMTVAGFSPDPNIVYVNVRRGGDKAGIYEYDLRRKTITEPAFEHRLFDAIAPIEADDGRLLGFTYDADTRHTYWTDPQLAAIAKGLPPALGIQTTSLAWTDPGGGQGAKVPYAPAADARLDDWSDDLKYAIVERSGPNQPPEYYLLTDGTKLTLLGRSRPQIDLSTLGDSQLIQYTARDGLVIPAFLHTPSKALYGPGPHPAIVLPHGGPSARDYLGWDLGGWTKYFTARGYVVIQPQFRGSEGWGARLARAGDAQWGKAMQDDNDDAAKWLIAQRLADPQRIALFGYSYGGYAAFVAAIRPNGLYQCSVAGAGVAEIKNFQGETYDDRFLREYQRPTIDGLDPLPNAKTASIPIFVYHGDRDQTVPVTESRRFVSALKAAGKPHRYLEIKDMGHQYQLMTADMLETQLVEIDKYLKTDCGPGGL